MNLRCAGLLVCAALLPMLGAGCASAGLATMTPSPETAATQAASARKLPADVDLYATTALTGGWRCEVGARLTGDLLQEHPVVYLVKPDGAFAWHKPLGVPEPFYQGRATHCVASDNRLYVLVQLDTDSRRSLNETVLRVAELNKGTGKLVTTRDVDVPRLSASSYTSWVDKGAGHFTLEGGKLVVRGKYELMSGWNSPSGEPHPFVAELPVDPHR